MSTAKIYIVARFEPEPRMPGVSALYVNPKPFIHEDFDVAKREASRLAAINPGSIFYVLGAEGFAQTRATEWVKCDEIPF